MVKRNRKKVLAIDYGSSKLGLAISSTLLAEPYKVIRYKKEAEIIEKVIKVVQIEQVEQVVLGVSEGKMAEETKEFGNKLAERLRTPIVYQDETFSTKDAQGLSIKSGMKRKKRKEMEDAYAACVILQNYLDKNNG